MFLSQPLLELLIARGIQDVDEFLKPPSTSDFANPFFLPNLEDAVSRVLRAVSEGARITIFGDYVERAIMLSSVVHIRVSAGRCAHFAPHNPYAAVSSLRQGINVVVLFAP